jgi:hypothetical protein
MGDKSVSDMSLDELVAERARLSGQPVNTGYKSVLDTSNAPEDTAAQNFGKFMESTLKGSARGLSEMVGGWGNLYDYLKQSKNPSALSSAGITKGIQDLTGVDIMKIPGFTGAFEFGRQAAPAGVATLAGAPGLFGNTAKGVAGEMALSGTGGLAADYLAPDSPMGSLAIQMLPSITAGGVKGLQNRWTNPVGTVGSEAANLQAVGPLTPGEATGSRVQLAREASAEANPTIERKGQQFRVDQAQSVDSFLTNLFNKTSSAAIPAQEVADKVSTSFTNYGKALAGKLKSQASSDFSAAEKAGGLVDTSPVVSRLKQLQGSLRPDLSPSDAIFSTKIQTVLDSLVRAEVPEVRAPSRIVSEAGTPAFESVTPGTPAGTNKISIGDLKRALSGWGDAAWSGNYALNGSNVFEGLAPGQAKGVARTVLNGFRDALNNAIDTNVPGADLLKDARTNFSKNLDKIDEFADMPVVKAFGKPANQLVPEDVVNVLKNQPPSQRALTIGILNNSAPEVMDSVRRAKFNDILEAGRVPNAPTGAPTVNFDSLLKALNKPDELGFLFTSTADKVKAEQAIKYMQQVLQKADGVDVSGLKGSDAYAITKASGGTTQNANLLKELFQNIKDIIATPNAMADVVFNKDTVNKMLAAQQKGTASKIGDASVAIGKVLANQGLRAGPRMSTDNPQVDNGETPTDINKMTLEQLQAERERLTMPRVNVPMQLGQ